MLLGVNYSTGAVFNATPVRACHAPDVFFPTGQVCNVRNFNQ